MRKLSLKELNRVSIKEYKNQEKTPLVIVLDNVRSALNVGSVFRTSDAFALEHLYLCGITAKPPHREILKTAIGAASSVHWSYHKEATKVVNDLKEKGYEVYAVEQVDDRIWLQDFEIKTEQKYAIVMGNEVKGVSNEVIKLVDGCLEVPQFGTKHSLNIAVCTGVVVWDLVKKMKYKK